MTRDLTLEGQVQVLLNELLGEQLISFPLSVGKISQKESGEFTVHFFDSRIRTARVVLAKGQSFRDGFDSRS